MTKLTLYYEALFFMVRALMPYEIHSSREFHLEFLGIILNVVLHYFELVPTLIVSNIVLMPVFLKRAIFFEEDQTSLVIGYVFSALWLSLNVVGLHVVMT